MSVVYFLLLVGAIVVIHEFGHFVAAKLLDFKVTRFSIGFGLPIVRVRAGETEYQIAWIPLGGSVHLLGEDPHEPVPAQDAQRAFHARPLWQRLIVVFAGPAANLLLPVAIYFAIHAGHTELPAAVIGDVLPDSPAQRAGLSPGDRITSIAGASVRYWEDVETAVQENVGREIKLRVVRSGRVIDTYLVPIERTMRRRDLTPVRQGLAGIGWRPSLPQVGVVDATSPAGRAGIRTGDMVISVDGRNIASYGELSRELSASARRMSVGLLRSHPVSGLAHVTLLHPELADLVVETEVGAAGRRTSIHGIHPAELVIASVDPGSPADVAGLRPGDLVRAIDGEPTRSWMELDQALQARPEDTFSIAWERPNSAGAVAMSADLVQVRQRHTDEYGHESQVLAFGARPDVERGAGHMVSIDRRFAYSLSKAVERTGETIGVMASGLWSIVRGRSLTQELGGPIMMYRVASVSGRQGWETFLLMIALVSVSVGLINLLPVPVLDGGHLVVFAVEAARGRRISPRWRNRITVAGLAFVGLITVLALSNDVMRYLL
jgi:regulator of sigma E protease